MFVDRHDAGLKLAELLKGTRWVNPLVLGVPRGGVVVSEAVARELGAALDVVLVRKLRAPYQREYAIGAVAEDGSVFLDDSAVARTGASNQYIREESQRQLEQLDVYGRQFRSVCAPATVEGRSVILVDDGMATGSTMLSAVQSVRARNPRDVVVAVPVASDSAVQRIESKADRVVSCAVPEFFLAVGQFYQRFEEVTDREVVEALRRAVASSPTG